LLNATLWTSAGVSGILSPLRFGCPHPRGLRMPLTPADVHNVAFSKPPIGKRGYNEDEVDAFLDLIEAELARLIEENNELRAQGEQLDQQVHAGRSDLDGARTQLGSVDPAPSRRLAPVPPPSSMEETAPGGMAGGDHHVQAAKVL